MHIDEVCNHYEIGQDGSGSFIVHVERIHPPYFVELHVNDDQCSVYISFRESIMTESVTVDVIFEDGKLLISGDQHTSSVRFSTWNTALDIVSYIQESIEFCYNFWLENKLDRELLGITSNNV